MSTTITFTLPGASLMSQLANATLDGLPNNDASDNCVGTSVAEGLHALTGRTYDGDEVKDAVYGAAYVGFESATAYVAYCASQGVTLSPFNGASQQALVDEIHAQVLAGHPVIVTMPSQWGTAPADPTNPSGFTHCGVAVGVGPGAIRVMNPWGGFWQDQPDSWWAARLCYGQVWPMALIGAATMSIPTGWTDDGTTLKAPGTGAPIVGAIRAYILSHPWAADDVPEGPENSTAQVEFSDPAHGAGVVQYFRHSAIASTQALGTYALYAGAECQAARALLNTALSQVATLKAQLAAAQATPPAPTVAPPTAQESAALAVVSAIRAALAS